MTKQPTQTCSIFPIDLRKIVDWDEMNQHISKRFFHHMLGWVMFMGYEEGHEYPFKYRTPAGNNRCQLEAPGWYLRGDEDLLPMIEEGIYCCEATAKRLKELEDKQIPPEPLGPYFQVIPKWSNP